MNNQSPNEILASMMGLNLVQCFDRDCEAIRSSDKIDCEICGGTFSTDFMPCFTTDANWALKLWEWLCTRNDGYVKFTGIFYDGEEWESRFVYGSDCFSGVMQGESCCAAIVAAGLWYYNNVLKGGSHE